MLVPCNTAGQLSEGQDLVRYDSNSSSDSTAFRLCGLGQVASPLSASAFSNVRRQKVLPLRS